MSIVNKLLNYIFPKDREILEMESLSPFELEKKLMRGGFLNNRKHYYLFSYKDKLVRKIVYEVKYRKNKILIKKCGFLLYKKLIEICGNYSSAKSAEGVRSAESVEGAGFLIVPVPASKRRIREYGYSQCHLLIKEIEKLDLRNPKPFFMYSYNNLKKIRETKYQNKIKNRKERLENLQNCFGVENLSEISGKNIILVDDVITTGATLGEISKVLKRAGAEKVFGIMIGH